MNDKQKRFADEYLIDCNATRAAIRAGYSEDTARTKGSELYNEPEINQYINEQQKLFRSTLDISKERIAQELALIAFGDTKILFDENGCLKSPGEWSNEGKIIASYEETVTEFGNEKTGGTKTTKKVRQWEKTKALEALCRLMGYNEPEKHQYSGSLELKQITGMQVIDSSK